MTERIQVSLVTGFLGSGKTSLINALLPTAEMANSAVLVNEFGQVSIDSDLIASAEDDVIELTNGCVCCALNEELAPSLVEFAKKRKTEQRPVDRVIIETTGLANAGPIIEVILEDPEVRQWFTLDKVITTVDALLGETNLDLHAQSVEQVAVADRLLLTKLDLVDSPDQEEAVQRLTDRLRQLNPGATLYSGDKTDVIQSNPEDDLLPARRFGSLPANGVSGADVRTARHDHHIKSFCIVSDKPKPLEELERFWRRLADEAGPNLLRVKGLIRVAEKPETPAVVQGVQHIFDSMHWLDSWPNDDHRTRIVFIGWMLDPSRIERMFESGA